MVIDLVAALWFGSASGFEFFFLELIDLNSLCKFLSHSSVDLMAFVLKIYPPPPQKKTKKQNPQMGSAKNALS